MKENLIAPLKKIYFKQWDINFWQLIELYLKEIETDNIDHVAKSMAFSFMMAIFPGIIFLFTLIPHIPIPDLSTNILAYLQQVLPKGIYEFVYVEINDIVSLKRTSLMSLGFLTALISATNGTLAMMSGFNACFKTKENRSFLRTRLVALFLTGILTFVLIFSVLVLIISELVINYFVSINSILIDLNYYLLIVSKPIIAFVTFYLSLASVYFIAPTMKEKWSFFSWGALFASAFSILATLLFGYYFTNFASYNKLYGSVGTIIALMFWLYIISIIILYGFELNVTISKLEKKHLLKNKY
jgi:membrane protein